MKANITCDSCGNEFEFEIEMGTTQLLACPKCGKAIRVVNIDEDDPHGIGGMFGNSIFGDLFGFDDSQSFEELVEEAENGDAYAMLNLATTYLNGDFEFEQDAEKSFEWMLKAAESDDASSDALFNIGLYYLKGFGTERDVEQATEWFIKANMAGDPDAMGLIKLCNRLTVAEMEANDGDAEAQAALAEIYMTIGNMLDQADNTKDFENCLKWARKSAEQNCPHAYWPLALAYKHGRGVSEDSNQATQYYKIGAELGDSGCQHSYGCLIMQGAVNGSEEEAFDLFVKSAEQGYGLAMKSLGMCYQFGNGVQDDMDKAIEWYEKALEIIDDEELEQKVSIFKMLPRFDEDDNDDWQPPEGYEDALKIAMEDEERFDDSDSIPEYEFNLTNTKKGDRKERSEKIKIGDKVTFKNNLETERVDVIASYGEIGDISNDSWLSKLADSELSYDAEVIEVVPYSQLENKRCNPTINIRLKINATCGEAREVFEWFYIPGGIYDLI